MMTEKELSDGLINKLKKVVAKPYLIGQEILVPYKHIYIPTQTSIRLELWCFAQDIIIYKTLFDKSVKHKDARITKGDDTLIDVILEKDKGQNTHPVGIPYVILELKKKQPNTHEIVTYSRKAEMIKTIFPYCQFLLLIQGRISPLTHRHGINFDEVISLKDVNDKTEIKRLRQTIQKHFEIAISSLHKLSLKTKVY